MHAITIRRVVVRTTLRLLAALLPEIIDPSSVELPEQFREWMGPTVDLLLLVSHGAVHARLRRRSVPGDRAKACPGCGCRASRSPAQR